VLKGQGQASTTHQCLEGQGQASITLSAYRDMDRQIHSCAYRDRDMDRQVVHTSAYRDKVSQVIHISAYRDRKVHTSASGQG